MRVWPRRFGDSLDRYQPRRIATREHQPTMRFADRTHAAKALAAALHEWRGKDPIVYAIPRGAVPMAAILAEALGGELDVILTRKLGAPGNPELAIGAVGESGWSFVDPIAYRIGVPQSYIDAETERQRAVIAKRRAEYTPARAPADAAGRVVIVVDDGIATGSTMIAALHELRAKRPSQLVCAVPVASADSAARVREHADRFVCLHVSREFWAVGQFYEAFDQIDDAEVIRILQVTARLRSPAARSRFR